MGTKAIIATKDPLTVTITNALEVVPELLEREHELPVIVSLDIPDVARIKLGDKLTLGKQKVVYRINKIERRDSYGGTVYDLRMATRTKATLFVLPMLPGAKHKYLYDQVLLNCFIGTPEKSDLIALLYRWSGLKDYGEMEKAFQALSNYIGHSDPTSSTVLYMFHIPEKYREDYEHFLAGRYSKMSLNYKRRILQFHNVDKENIIGQILFKAPERKKLLEERLFDSVSSSVLPVDAELFSIPDLFSEQYHPEIYNI